MSQEQTAVEKANGNTAPVRLTPEMERMDAIARQASALAKSTIIPEDYRGSPSNCLVAIDMAHRSNLGVLTVMQNLHVIHGRPSWGSSFLIGAVNASGRFSPLRFEVEGETGTAGWKCRAVATSLEDGESLEGPWVTWEMAQAEGWVSKSHSKWKTMPDLMIRYRAAAFWSRLFAPEIAMGFLTHEEAEDIPAPPKAHARKVAEMLRADDPDEDEPAVVDAEVVEDEDEPVGQEVEL